MSNANPYLRLCDPILLVGFNRLGCALHAALRNLGFRDVMVWVPDHRSSDNRSLGTHFGRHHTKVFWGHDTPERVFVATIIALDVHPGTIWPLRFGRIMRVPDVFTEGLSGEIARFSPLLNDVRRIMNGDASGKDMGFRDEEMVTLYGLGLACNEGIEAERIEEPEPEPPRGVFETMRSALRGGARA